MHTPISLPYTHEVYMTAMAGFNAAWIVAVAGLFLLLAASFALLVRGQDRSAGVYRRTMVVLLAASAVVVGAAHQLSFMADFNFLAPIYGIAWILYGAMLLWIALQRRDSAAGPSWIVDREGEWGSGQRWIGMLVAGFGLLVYPVLVVLLAGGSFASVPLAGSAPNATALVHIGFALMMFPRPPIAIVALALVWSVVTGVTALLLEFPFDLLAAAMLLIACVTAIRARIVGRADGAS